MNKVLIVFFTVFATAVFIVGDSAAQADKKITFDEIWVYLMKGEEQFFKPEYPITDIGYFSAEIDAFGNLVGIPQRAKIKNFAGRTHLVIAQVNNRALTHFAIDPKFPIRAKLIEDIIKAARDFDGLQIDFEVVPKEDRENFYSFLRSLKSRLGRKPLSVAIGARTKYVSDAYEYDKIAAIADRIIIMAYDEHWSSSAPGAVASLEWGSKVAIYALQNIEPSKLVMGLPFYGRAWASINPARAYKYSGILKLTQDKNISNIEFKDGLPFFRYQETVDVTVFFDNAETTMLRANLYYGSNIRNIAFWRLGQEEISVWNNFEIAKSSRPNTLTQNPEPPKTKKTQSPPKTNPKNKKAK